MRKQTTMRIVRPAGRPLGGSASLSLADRGGDGCTPARRTRTSWRRSRVPHERTIGQIAGRAVTK